MEVCFIQGLPYVGIMAYCGFLFFFHTFLYFLCLQCITFVLQVYEGLSYRLSLEFPSSYPYTAPTVKFITTCFHPNVDLHGNICLDILKEKWSASYDVRAILLSIQSLLGGKSLHHLTTVGIVNIYFVFFSSS